MESESIHIAVLGYGRMGQEVRRCIDDSDDMQVAGIWIREGGADGADTAIIRSADLASILSLADIAIDFTLPAATDQVIAASIEAHVPLVCGVSGLTAAHRQHMAEAAAKIPLLYDRNLSLGVAVMHQLVRIAGAALGEQFAAEIHETHHARKLDAPSGTALHLGETLATSRGQEFAAVYHYDRDSSPVRGDIHYEVTRRDEVPGEHTVHFKSADEVLSLQHKVTDRRVFAVGATKAARWLRKQRPGLYSMQDLLVGTSQCPPE